MTTKPTKPAGPKGKSTTKAKPAATAKAAPAKKTAAKTATKSAAKKETPKKETAKKTAAKAVVKKAPAKAAPAPSLSETIRKWLDADKGEDIVTIDLAGKSAIADAMIVASGRSSRHVAAMAEHVLENLKKAGAKVARAEGMTRGDWVLIDAGDVIVHLFRPEVRKFYALEKLWNVDETGPDAVAVKP